MKDFATVRLYLGALHQVLKKAVPYFSELKRPRRRTVCLDYLTLDRNALRVQCFETSATFPEQRFSCSQKVCIITNAHRSPFSDLTTLMFHVNIVCEFPHPLHACYIS